MLVLPADTFVSLSSSSLESRISGVADIAGSVILKGKLLLLLPGVPGVGGVVGDLVGDGVEVNTDGFLPSLLAFFFRFLSSLCCFLSSSVEQKEIVTLAS